MSGEAVIAVVGLFGKLPAHGDFVRRGLPVAVTTTLDGWLQREFGRADDPAAAIAGAPPIRFATTALAAGQLALGAMVASSDRIGRRYVVVAVHLTPHLAANLPEPVPDVWDDWCARAEALLTAAQGQAWTADATQAALEAAARASVVALVAPPLVLVTPDAAAETLAWRQSLDSGESIVLRGSGLPSGDDFDRLTAPLEVAA